MTDVQDEDIDALTSLGLTMLQATVYLTLVESENLTIKGIAKNTGVARQDLYRITSELQDCGLVEQVITKPITYKAIPLKTGVDILLGAMQRKRNEAQKNVAQLLERYKTKEITFKPKAEKSQFVLVPGKNALILKEKHLLTNAQETASFITSRQRFSQKLYSLIEEFKKAVASDVKIRILMEKTDAKKNMDLMNTLSKSCNETTSFEVRYVMEPPPVVLSVFDNKEVLLVTTATAGLPESPALWSNNNSLVKLANNYFEILWITAIETDNPVSLRDLKREGTFLLF